MAKNKHKQRKRERSNRRRAAERSRRERELPPSAPMPGREVKTDPVDDVGALVRRLQSALHQGDVAAAEHLLRVLKEGQDAPPALRAYLRILEADYLVHQSDFEGARRLISQALEEEPNAHLRAIAWVSLASIEMREGTTEGTLDLLEQALGVAREVGDDALAGDAAFNIGTLYAERGKNEEAVEKWKEARASYTASDRIAKARDCDHHLAVFARVESSETEDDIDALCTTLLKGIASNDFALVSRVGGDLARTHLCRHLEGLGDELDLADAILEQVSFAEHLLWERAALTERTVGARIEIAAQHFNNIETALLVAHAQENWGKALAISAAAKARILRDDLSGRTYAGAERFRGLDDAFAEQAPEGLAMSALAPAIDELAQTTGKKIALIDHFALSNDDLFLSIYITDGNDDAAMQCALVSWPGERSDPLFARRLRGRGQAVAARTASAALDTALERLSGVAAMFYGEECEPDDGQKTSLREYAEEISEPLRLLGTWCFPQGLRKALVTERVSHVFLSPDPRLFSLPWSALSFENNRSVVDEEWSLSILPSPLSIYDVLRRHQIQRDGIKCLAPDPEVNERLGGRQELEAIKRCFPSAVVSEGADASRAALHDALKVSGWLHLRTHGTHDGEVHVPRLADGPWQASTGDQQSACTTVVSTSCRTGETITRGQDVFGLVELAERDDVGALVTPMVSVEGFAAMTWMTRFYEALADGAGIGAATKRASISVRERLVHPAFWGVYLCVGDPWRRPR